MANRRTIKKNISALCTELFAECVAASLYNAQSTPEDTQALLRSVILLEDDFRCRVSHVEPGMKAKDYFKDLVEKFNAQMSDIIDQINNLS